MTSTSTNATVQYPNAQRWDTVGAVSSGRHDHWRKGPIRHSRQLSPFIRVLRWRTVNDPVGSPDCCTQETISDLQTLITRCGRHHPTLRWPNRGTPFVLTDANIRTFRSGAPTRLPIKRLRDNTVIFKTRRSLLHKDQSSMLRRYTDLAVTRSCFLETGFPACDHLPQLLQQARQARERTNASLKGSLPASPEKDMR